MAFAGFGGRGEHSVGKGGDDGGGGTALLRQQVEGVGAERELLGVEPRVPVVGVTQARTFSSRRALTAVRAF